MVIMFKVFNKDGSQYISNEKILSINVTDQYLSLDLDNDSIIIVELENTQSIQIEENEFYVYTGKQYDKEMKVDYEQFCDLSEEVRYEDLDENYCWSAKKVKEREYIVCNGMLEILESHIL
jgi:hypothetical protein